MVRWLVSLLVLCAACGAGEPAPEVAEGEDQVIGGAPTASRPEIGRLSFGGSCTATLIGPRAAITAAHCVGYQTSTAEGRYGQLHVDLPDLRTRSFTVDRYRSWASTTGADDLALVHLAEAVPAAVATPAAISERRPEAGETVTLFGYGCTDRATGEGSFIKRSISFAYAASSALCPGDSGGPVVIGADGPIALINSAYFIVSGEDVFAHAFDHRAELVAQVEAWDPREPEMTEPEMPKPEMPEMPEVPPPLPDADGDGVPDAQDLCGNTPAGARVWQAGEWIGCAGGQRRDRAPDADGDGVPDSEDLCSLTPRGARVWRSGPWLGCAGGQYRDRG